MSQIFANWLTNIKSDDIDGGLAADFDGSLSGLGVELGSAPYNMSEALLALPVFKQEVFDHGFQYVLSAPTSSATKLNEETLTYLNQGQSYEVKLKKLGELGEYRGVKLKSIVRVVFHDRRLQFMEREQMDTWKLTRPGERVLDIDVPLSYGVTDVRAADAAAVVAGGSGRLNAVEVTWNASVSAGVHVRVNCISTEFTPRKHGGEKGVPFRLQIETYSTDDCGGGEGSVEGYGTLLNCASCQVKVFKPKGADRKQKIDRERNDKRSEFEKQKYQPSYECTVLTEIPLDQVRPYLDQMNPSSPEVKETKDDLGGLTSFKHALDLSGISDDSSFSSEPNLSKLISELPPKDESPEPEPPAPVDSLSACLTAHQVTQWLQANRFSAFVKLFQNYTGSDVLRLSRDDLIQICGLADGIRLNNALQSRNVRPKLTIYVCQKAPQAPVKKAQKVSAAVAAAQPSASSQPISGAAKRADSTLPSSHSSSLSSSPRVICGAAKRAELSSSSLSLPALGDSPPLSMSPPGGRCAYYSPSTSPGGGGAACHLGANVAAIGDAITSLSHGVSCASLGERHVARPGTVPAAPPVASSSKRQLVEHDDDVADDANVSYSKKQKTRNLELSHKEVYLAVYLDALTLLDLREKLAALFSIATAQVIEVFMQGPSSIHILITDDVVQNFLDQARFFIEATHDDNMPDKYWILLKSANDSVAAPVVQTQAASVKESNDTAIINH